MAPGGGAKRKRGDRSFSGDSRDEASRPSPHRPDSLSLGQRNQQQSEPSPSTGRGGLNDRGRGNRRGARGGQSDRPQSSPIRSPTGASQPAVQQHSPTQESLSSKIQPPEHQGELKPPFTSTQRPSEPTPAEDQSTDNSKTKALVFHYEFLTEEVVKAWEESGKNDTISFGVKARNGANPLELSILFQELIEAGINARVDPAEAGTVVKDIIGASGGAETSLHAMINDSLDVSSIFLDTLSMFLEGRPPSPSLSTMVFATKIPPAKIRLELDSTLLESLGLIRSTFVRMGIRQQTNLLYRQSNYNLLREETEGYSKLVTELFTTSSHEPPTSAVIAEMFEKVKGMVGSFDLDVGRVLDVTLDVFAAVLVKQYRFFVKYLRASSWWPSNSHTKHVTAQHCLGPLPRWALPGFEGRSLTDEEREEYSKMRTERDIEFWQRCKEIGLPAFFELGGRRVDQSMLDAALDQPDSEPAKSAEDREWIETTRTLPPVGNKVAAQILGFKLRFYSSSARHPSDVLPVNLTYLAALLIKVGFISLRDLYPHVWPLDTDMEKVREEKMEEKAERERLNRPGGGTNALLSAAPLPDDTLEGQSREATRLRDVESARKQQKADLATSRSTPVAQSQDKMDELPAPADQKVQLLKSLLSIGALPEALYLLGRFPWLPDAYPELSEYIHRILHHCVNKLYESRRPLKDESGLRTQKKIAELEVMGVSHRQVRLTEPPPRRIMRWAQLDRDDAGDAIDYRFYWDDWADIIPVCQNVDDLFTLCSTLLNYSGVKIGKDPALLLKLCRIGSSSLASDPSDANSSRWLDLSKRLLLPALSFTKCNPGVVNEVYELIKNYPEATRYNLYAEWNVGQISRTPDIKSAFDQTKAETRDVLKRISKTTIKPMARALAKVTYSSPGIVFPGSD